MHDELGRQRVAQLGLQISLSGLDEPVDHVIDEVAHPGLERLKPANREKPRQDVAIEKGARRIDRNRQTEHLIRWEARNRDAGLAAERDVVLGHGGYILVARQDVETVPGIGARDRTASAQIVEDRLAMRPEFGGVVIEVRIERLSVERAR